MKFILNGKLHESFLWESFLLEAGYTVEMESKVELFNLSKYGNEQLVLFGFPFFKPYNDNQPEHNYPVYFVSSFGDTPHNFITKMGNINESDGDCCSKQMMNLLGEEFKNVFPEEVFKDLEGFTKIFQTYHQYRVGEKWFHVLRWVYLLKLYRSNFKNFGYVKPTDIFDKFGDVSESLVSNHLEDLNEIIETTPSYILNTSKGAVKLYVNYCRDNINEVAHVLLNSSSLPSIVLLLKTTRKQESDFISIRTRGVDADTVSRLLGGKGGKTEVASAFLDSRVDELGKITKKYLEEKI